MARPDATRRATPLRRWRERHEEVSYEELARRAGLSTRTVMRAAAGDLVDADSAAALERVTKIPASTFLETGKSAGLPEATERDGR